MDSGPQSAVDGGGGRSSGKVYKRRRTSARKTPYDRPTPPAQPQSPNWFNGLVYPAKFVAGGASKLLSSIWYPKSWGSHSSSSDSDSDSGAIEDDLEDNGNLSDGCVELNQNQGSSSGKSEILYLVEQLIMLERYSREECDRLIEIINSRVVDYTMGEGVNAGAESPDAHSQVVLEARKLISENMVGSSSKSNMENRPKSLTTPNRDCLSPGSWNIQDEIQRLRSKATEDMISRHQSPKLDKILEVVKPIQPNSVVAPQPEGEVVNLASDGDTLGLSDLTTTEDNVATEAFSSLPTIQEKEVEKEEDEVKRNGGSEGSSNTNDGTGRVRNSPVTRAMARTRRRHSQTKGADDVWM